MMGDVFKTGDLVRLKRNTWYSDAYGPGAVGIVLTPPEFHGFVTRCYVMWGPNVKEWADIEDLEMVSDISTAPDGKIEE